MITSAVFGGLLALLFAVPLSWKWQLGVMRVGLAVAGLAAICALIVAVFRGFFPLGTAASTALVCLSTLGAGTAILLYRFYRDPERRPPKLDSGIVSPADGEVLYVKNVRQGILPVANKQGRNYTLTELTRSDLHTQDAVVVGIGMSFMDVHVNRAPISGRVVFRRHFPGRFGSLRSPAMVFENERATTVIEREGIQIAVVQIASRLVRQIVSYIHEGDELAIGDRIGMIRFGSQVDLVVPARSDMQLLVQPGERVWAGESVIAMVGSRVWRAKSVQSQSPRSGNGRVLSSANGLEARAPSSK